jgi:hypothetical protein
MSYDIYLKKDDELVKIPRHEEGGTYQIGGTEEAALNVTYNDSWFFYRYLDETDGIRWLYGKTGAEVIERLEKAVEVLGTNEYKKDYWAPTPGNAGKALATLLHWAKLHPDAVFEGD